MPETAPDGDESGSSALERKGPTQHRYTVMKVVAASMLVLAIVTAGAVTFAYRHLNGNITTEDFAEAFVEPRLERAEPTGPKGPINILVMGSDTRAGKGNNIDNETGLGERSDTTILVHLSGDRKRAYGISIPRDSLVTRPDCKDTNGDVVPGAQDAIWNEAFNLAGPGCTISQFEQTTGVAVDHYVVVDFQGFQDMVDAVGGVPVCIPETVDDREHGIYLEAGTRDISGKEALSYVRQRYAVGDGSDIGRLKRQQAFMSSMANRVVSAGTLANPFTLFDFLDAATKSLTVDDGLGNLTKIARLGLQFRNIGLDKIQFSTIPSGYDVDDPNRIRWKPTAKVVWERIDNDEPLTARQSSQAISADEAPSGTPSGNGSPSGAGSPSGGTTPSDSPTQAPPDNAAAERAAKVGLCT